MTVPLRHKHAEQHRGIVPEDQLGATTPAAGDVLTASGTGEPDWAAPAAAGAPDDADYLVGTAHGDLTSEIVVGTTPGGELGGTWASPTVDATHSGSSHAATQAAAEATAATALAGHTGDTTDAHDASAISYDNVSSGLTATDVQAAIDELEGMVGGSSSVATDSIWDAAGDLAVGTGSNTAARLAKGPAGANLSTYNGVVAWNGGTSFPASPATGDRFWRSDLGMEFYYDGTRWLSVETGQLLIGVSEAVMPYSSSLSSRAPAPIIIGSDIWLVSHQTWFFVVGGTALSGSHKWVGTLLTVAGTIDTITIDSGASSAHRQTAVTAIGALMGSGAMVFVNSWVKTGTPGPLHALTHVLYRHVAT